jgi:phosphatidylserine decarboxylase
MAALEKNDPPGEGVKWRFPSVHPEGRKFAVIAAAITGVNALVGWQTFAWLMLGVTAWVLAFFRDPIRTTPRSERFIIAPADGMVTLIQSVPAPKELVAELGEGHFTRVSIFMSVFDVHINRTPIAGTIKQVVYIAGKFLNADLDKASEDNERQHFVVERNDGAKVGIHTDRRAGCTSDRPVREGWRYRRSRPAHRIDPLRKPRRCLPASGNCTQGGPWPALCCRGNLARDFRGQ